MARAKKLAVGEGITIHQREAELNLAQRAKQLGVRLSRVELRAAVQAMDRNGDGIVTQEGCELPPIERTLIKRVQRHETEPEVCLPV